MGKSLSEIAEELRDKNKKVHHIIYPVVSAVHHQQIIDLIAN